MRKRFRPQLLLAALLLLAPASAAAQQGVIAGRVTDVETGAPLDAVQISIVGSLGTDRVGVLTNAQGTYRIAVPPGTYAVVAQHIGFADQRRDGVGVGAGEQETVDLQMTSRATVLNPIVVTASRRQEKALESPSTVVTVGEEQIEERATVTPVDHMKGLPGVDIVQTGLTQANVVTRGFNNIFSGALLVITDNRYAHVPSLRFNAWNMIPASQMDVERMEVLLGPAAALYGPNSANGVLHIITKSPLDEQETQVSVAAGERDIFQGQFRTAFKTSENTGFKISGTYFQGHDWVHLDSAEVEARRDAIAAGAPDDESLLIGLRDFDTNRWGTEARFDWRPGEDTEFIVNGGLNTVGSSVELTGGGPGQAKDWRYSYLQTRFRSGRLFAQAFVNQSDAGDTYLLETGNSITDKSKLWVAQVQHGMSFGETVDLIYGVDAAWTRPKTEGTINGRNEDDDAIDEIGGYLQSQIELTSKLELVGALRFDDHSHLEDPVWSPRAALVFRPAENQNFRVSYNRAFTTPTSNNLFLDLVFARVPITQQIGYDIRLRGVPSGGFTFNDTCAGGVMELCMYTPFAPGTQLPANGLPLWNGLVQQLVPAQLRPALMNPGAAPGDPSIGSLLRRFDREARGFPDVDEFGPQDIGRITPTLDNTYEIGYKGILGGRLLLAADLYQQRIEDFVGPLKVETPSVFYDPATVQAFVLHRLGPLIQAGLVSQAQATQIITGFSSVPLGTISPDGEASTDLMFTYRNFGEVDFWGGDLAFQFLATDQLSFKGSYAHVSKECFDFDGVAGCEGAQDITLNAPQNKGSLGVRWENLLLGFAAEAQARHVEGFQQNSGAFVGDVPAYTVVDANVQYNIRTVPGATVTLSAYNLFDNEHREFIGAPEIGRLLLLRLGYTF